MTQSTEIHPFKANVFCGHVLFYMNSLSDTNEMTFKHKIDVTILL